MVSTKVLKDFNNLEEKEEGAGVISDMCALLVVADRLERIAEAINRHAETVTKHDFKMLSDSINDAITGQTKQSSSLRGKDWK